MPVGSLIAIYFVVWWVVLFAVLPFGVRTQDEADDVILGTASSAPMRPLLLRKAIATTIISAILVGGFWIAVARYGVDLETLGNLFGARQ